MIYHLATVVLGPVLLAQGRFVRRTVARLPEPSGSRDGCSGTGPLLRLLIIGDSAAAGVGADTQEAALAGHLVAALQGRFQVQWKLVAYTGATSHDVLATLETVAKEPFDIVVTSLGVNDVTARASLQQWRAVQIGLIALLHQKFGARHILLSALPPMHLFPALPQPLRWYIGTRARQFNQLLKKIADMHAICEFTSIDYDHLDARSMAADGFHPGPPIYRQWAMELAQRIVARCVLPPFPASGN